MYSYSISKKAIAALFALFLVIALSLGVIQPAYAANTIAISKASLSVDVDSTVTLYLTGQSADAVSWESSNTNAAVIESSTSRKAVVRGVGKGASNIVATDESGNKSTCTVTVKVPKFTITSNLLLAVENNDYYDVENGYIEVIDGEAVDWKSSNNDIVSIQESDSSHARVVAEGVGTAVITATDKYGSESKCTIKVRQEPFEIGLTIDNDPNGYGYDQADFSNYWMSYYQEGWWDNDYNYHDSYYYYESLDFYHVYPYYGTITKCTSANNNVVTVSKGDGGYLIYPKGVGTTTVTATDPYGETEKITCRVTFNYFLEKETKRPEDEYGEYGEYNGEYLETKKYNKYNNLKYGSGKLTGRTYNYAKVTATIKGKTYSGKANSSGYYSISVPKYIRIKTGITIKISQYGITETIKRKVVKNNPSGTLTYKVNGKNIKVTVKNVHKGDYIKLKVGKKTYKKKFKKDYKKTKYTVKTQKLKKGTKVKIIVYNKFKQILKSKTITID